MVTFSPDTKKHDGTSVKYKKLYKVLSLYMNTNGALVWSDVTIDPKELSFYIYEIKTLYNNIRKKITDIKESVAGRVHTVKAVQLLNSVRVPLMRKGSRDYNKVLFSVFHMSQLQSMINGLEYHLKIVMNNRLMMCKMVEFGPDNYDDWVLV